MNISHTPPRYLSAAVFLGVTTIAAAPCLWSEQMGMQESGCGVVVPAPPFMYYPQGQNRPSQPVVPGTQALPIAPGQGPITSPEELKRHQAKQDPNDPTHAFDSSTGQNLSWDSSKNTWVDSESGQSVGFDGAQTSNGTIIPAPPIMYYPQGQNQPNQPVVPGTQALPIAPGQGPVSGPDELKSHQAKQDPSDPTHAFDSTTGQNLFWDSSKNSWVDSQTGQSLGFDGRCVSPQPASGPQTPPSPQTPPTNTPPPATSTTQPAPHSPVSMSGFVPSIQLRGFGGASLINGNRPSTSGFDGAVLFPLGNRVLVGPTAGFQWVDSSIVKTIGSHQPGSTFVDASAGFKEGNVGLEADILILVSAATHQRMVSWMDIDIGVTGGATVANSAITQASGFCGTGGPTAPPGCTVLSTTTTHDMVVGPFVGGYLLHPISSHIGIFVAYDYRRLNDTKPNPTNPSGPSVSVFDLHSNDVVAGIVLSFGRHHYARQ
ncbi:MAG TPA: hypothetical protein VGT08_13425 [Terracidiphilus sp.]|nr:hypothetical protein [Terracidiphilus sp.]